VHWLCYELLYTDFVNFAQSRRSIVLLFRTFIAKIKCVLRVRNNYALEWIEFGCV